MSVIVENNEDDEIVSFLNSKNNDNTDNNNDIISSSSKEGGVLQSSSSSPHNQHNQHNHHQQQHHLLSDMEVGISLAKAIMGAGSFSLPWAFSNMGYIGGPLALIGLMVMSIWSMKLLIDCNNSSHQQQTQTSSSYVELSYRIFGPIGAKLTYVASISSSIGVCGSYLVFVAANLQSLTDQWFLSYDNDDNDDSSNKSSSSFLSQTTWIIIITPIAIGLSSIQNMKRFAFASLLGDIAVVLGMVVVIVYAIRYSTPKYSSSSDECVAFGKSFATMALSFGSIGYLFLIHFLVLPIQSNMSNKQNFHKVVIRTFTLCALLSGIFGIIGYLYFGSTTNQIVLLNIKNNDNDNDTQSQPMVFVQIVQLLLCIDLLFTYPVVMRPSIVILLQQQQQQKQQQNYSNTIIIQQTQQHSSSSSSTPTPTTATRHQQHHHHSQYTYYGICIVLGLIAATCTLIVPAFGVLSGFVGGVSQTFLAFVLPPLMYMKTMTKPKSCDDDDSSDGNNNNRKQHQNQVSIANVLFQKNDNNHNKSPLGLVVTGIILILWTLGSTWNEVMSPS